MAKLCQHSVAAFALLALTFPGASTAAEGSLGDYTLLPGGIAPGSSVGYSALPGPFPQFDSGTFRVSGRNAIFTFTVIDCCIQGDTITAFLNPQTGQPQVQVIFVSPTVGTASYLVNQGTTIIGAVGYVSAALFPAGYYWRARMGQSVAEGGGGSNPGVAGLSTYDAPPGFAFVTLTGQGFAQFGFNGITFYSVNSPEFYVDSNEQIRARVPYSEGYGYVCVQTGAGQTCSDGLFDSRGLGGVTTSSVTPTSGSPPK